MVRIHNIGPSRKSLLQNALGQSLGQGLSNFTNNYFAGKALDDVINNKEFEKAEPSERASRLEQALRPYGEYGAQALQSRMGIEQKIQQEQEQRVLADINSGKEVNPEKISKLSPENQFKILELQKKRNLGKQIKESLKNAGYPEETQDLWANQMEAAPVGGQSDVIRNVNELLRRSKSGKGLTGEEPKNTLKPAIEIPGIDNQEYELDFPELKEKIGRTPSDMVKEEGDNRKINTPLYSDTIDSLNALDEDFRDIKQLQEYNENPDALPSGGEKWNVDWNTGDLRFKALASPESQDYVKIIARLLGRAKEYFPGRVTNFDLDQFRQRFPTLANSREGRSLIAKQLSLANRIAFLKDETIKAAIDHYGAEGDPVQIRKYAQQNYRRLKGELEGELKGMDQQADQLSNNEQIEVPEGDVLVTFNGQKGTMPKQKYEEAIKQGHKYELVK